MILYLIFIAFLTNSMQFENIPSCKTLTTCDCLQPIDNYLPIEIHCPNFGDDQMQIYYRSNISVLIQCLPPINWKLFNEQHTIEPLRENGNISQLDIVKLGFVDDLKVSHCNLSNAIDQLQNLLKHTQPKYVSLRSNIVITNELSQLSQEDQTLFDSIDTLNLENNNLFDTPYKLFNQIKHLKHISLNFNKIQSLNESFDKKLVTLQIAQNNVNFIDQDAFGNLKMLETLHLWSNNITHIETQHFRNLNNLKYLELSRNFIQELHPNTFSTLPQLKTINLESNLLNSLPENLFINNKNLESIRLARNKHLVTLPPNFFANLPDLQNIRLDSCNLMHLTANLFSNSFNLEIIYLNENALNELPSGLFKGLKRLKVLNLANNNLRKLPQDLFKDLTSLSKLDISGNYLHFESNSLRISSNAIDGFRTKFNITTDLNY